MDDAEAPPTMYADIETEVKEMMGLFDVPAFARRGHDLEITLRRLHERCQKARFQLLDMVHLRLRQWSRAVTGPNAWTAVFAGPIEPLWPLATAEPPIWGEFPAPIRRQRIIAGDLIAAVLRFNRRWEQYVQLLNLEPVNAVIDGYNRFYVLEKECVMGSARLAARNFQHKPLLTTAILLDDHPPLPVPELRVGAGSERDGTFSPFATTHEQTGYHVRTWFSIAGRSCLIALAVISAPSAGPTAVAATGQTATERSVERKQAHAPTSEEGLSLRGHL